jgi:chorismate-pyruvate lyase
MTKALACLAGVNVLAVRSCSSRVIRHAYDQTSHETLATQASDSITAALGMMQNKVNVDICRRKYAEIERIEKRLDNEIEKRKSFLVKFERC